MTGGEQVACLAIAICFCVSVTLLAIDSVLAWVWARKGASRLRNTSSVRASIAAVSAVP